MTPAEVIAMRDKLTEGMRGSLGHVLASTLADWLIKSGWVTSEPGEVA